MLEDGIGSVPFFKSVADFNKKDINVVVPKKQEYWDFGTSERYYSSIRKLFEDLLLRRDTEFLKFCLDNGGFDLSKVSKRLKSYGNNGKPSFLNFGKVAEYDFFALMRGNHGDSSNTLNDLGLYYREIFDRIADRLY